MFKKVSEKYWKRSQQILQTVMEIIELLRNPDDQESWFFNSENE